MIDLGYLQSHRIILNHSTVALKPTWQLCRYDHSWRFCPQRAFPHPHPESRTRRPTHPQNRLTYPARLPDHTEGLALKCTEVNSHQLQWPRRKCFDLLMDTRKRNKVKVTHNCRTTHIHTLSFAPPGRDKAETPFIFLDRICTLTINESESYPQKKESPTPHPPPQRKEPKKVYIKACLFSPYMFSTPCP